MEGVKVKEVAIVYGCTSEALEEEYYVVAETGSYSCDRIEYHEPKGKGDRHFVDVYRGDNVIRLFNPTRIIFEPEDKLNELLTNA